jgi:peptidoglycan/LPS O-acetylase OafA/YrhL
MTNSNQSNRGLGHIPALDGLRGIAILLVFLTHIGNELPGQIHVMPWGWIGVRLFFVLSGYLITRILLEARDAAPFDYSLRVFYARRALRIFPVYYLALAIAWIVGRCPAPEPLLWYLTYTANWMGLFHREGALGLFWTLAVEEQFYAVWPCLVLLIPARWLIPGVLAVVAIGPTSRGALLWAGLDPFTVIPQLTPCCMDTLGMGAVFALLAQTKDPKWVRFIGGFVFFGGLSLLLIVRFWFGFYSPVGAIWADFAMATCFAPIVHGATNPSNLFAFLRFRPLRYTGKISYGLYVYHLFSFWLVPDDFGPPWVVMLLRLLASFAMATASWYLFEVRLLSLKRYFPVRPPLFKAGTTSLAAVE